jgi:predicted anti-sigma-YlaC factor YlaD
VTAHPPQEQISAWLDGQLGPEETAQVELHLRQCESCFLLQKEMASTTELFRGLEALETPAYLWTRITAELPRPVTHDRFSWLRWQGIEWVRRRQILAVAAVLVAITGSAILALLHYQARERFELTVIAQIDDAHVALAAKDAEVYNPFHPSIAADPDSNPFTRHRLDADSNPFGAIGKRR